MLLIFGDMIQIINKICKIETYIKNYIDYEKTDYTIK